MPKLYIKRIEFLSQTLIFLSLYICNSVSETLDISNLDNFDLTEKFMQKLEKSMKGTEF